ncbi:MAG: hypothetical protein HKN92_08870 [Chitinophagales bacterium]|nr:hypothetical protein [Chitinophagales bacterium]
MKTILILILLSSACQISNAQISSSWTASVDGQIIWQEVTPLGDLIVSTTSALYGIKPADGSINWKLDELSNIQRDQFSNISNSTFTSVMKANSAYIIEPVEGLIVFDSEKAGMAELKGQYFLYRHNGVLVVGKDQNGKDMITMVGMNSGKKLWDLKEDFGRIISVEEITDDEILIVNLFNVYLVKSGTGDVVWKNATSKQAASLDKLGAFGALMKNVAEEMTADMDFDLKFFLSKKNSIYYLAFTKKQESTIGENTTISFKNIYTAYELTNGKEVWDKPVEMNGKVGHVVLHENGLIILPDDGNRSRINMLDYKSGEGMWGKKGNGFAIKGGVYDYLRLKDGILVVTNTSNNDYLNFLDPIAGIMTFDKAVKIKGKLAGSFKVDKGIFYITNEEMNILNIQSGELILGKSIQTKPELTVQSDHLIYAFDIKDGIVKKVDLKTATVSEINAEKIKFSGNEDPSSIELRENGIFVNSDQNLVLIDFDGKIKYQEYYAAPRESGWKRALLYAQAIRASLISAQAYYVSGVMGVAEPYARQENEIAGEVVGGLGDVYNDLGNVASDYAANAFRAAGNRFKASSEGRDFQIVLTQLEDKTIVLAKIDKDNGEIENYIDLGKDREPTYAVDDIFGTVFLKSNTSEISCFEF